MSVISPGTPSPSTVKISTPTAPAASSRQNTRAFIHQHRAGPAFALFAGILGSPQAEPFAQDVQQALAEPGWLDLVFLPVDLELVVLLDQQWTRSQNARAAARWAMTEIAWRRYRDVDLWSSIGIAAEEHRSPNRTSSSLFRTRRRLQSIRSRM